MKESIKNQDFPLVTSLVLAGLLGGIAAIVALPVIAPVLSSSLLSVEQNYFWYLARGTAITGYLLLWLNMMMGIGMSSKLSNTWPGRLISSELHQFTSLLGILFSVVHGLLLLGDQYLSYSILQVFIPFSSTIYRPFWVGLGQISVYLWGTLILSFYIRKKIGKKIWRVFHLSGYLTFVFVLLHGIFAGTDAGTPWMTAIYWSTGSIILALTFYRVAAMMQVQHSGLS